MVSFEGEARGDARKEKGNKEERLDWRDGTGCMCIYLYICRCIVHVYSYESYVVGYMNVSVYVCVLMCTWYFPCVDKDFVHMGVSASFTFEYLKISDSHISLLSRIMTLNM
jgi:hypothetical protein